MATVYLLDSVKVATSTTGTGSVTVGAAEPGYLTPAEAGAVDGRVYTWRLDDGDDFEIFRGTYSSSGPTVSRDEVLVSKVSGVAGTSKLNLSGSAYLSCVPVAQWMQAPYVQNINDGPLSGFRNKIINGDGRINQRGASTIGDDTYGHDRHYALTQAGNITVSTLTAPAGGIASMMRLTQANATAQRMGYAQIIEAAETYGLRGKTVTLGGKLRFSAAAPVRFAVLEWTGTADQVTSDVVNSWTSASYTAGNFFISSNLTVAAVGSITPVANTITNWSITATISASANNLIVFYWTQDAAAQNATLDMRWYLVEGDATAEDDPFSPRHVQQEIALCQRYYEKSYHLETPPGTVTVDGCLQWFAGGTFRWHMANTRFQTSKRVTPSITLYSPATGTSGRVYNAGSQSDVNGSVEAVGIGSFNAIVNDVSLTDHLLRVHWVADSEL